MYAIRSYYEPFLELAVEAVLAVAREERPVGIISDYDLLAGVHAYTSAMASADPLTVTMGALAKKVPAETAYLLIAGVIMSYNFV